jgi:hypothetical protein
MKLNMTRQLLLAMLITTTIPSFNAHGTQPLDEVEQRGLQQLIRETEESLATGKLAGSCREAGSGMDHGLRERRSADGADRNGHTSTCSGRNGITGWGQGTPGSFVP